MTPCLGPIFKVKLISTLAPSTGLRAGFAISGVDAPKTGSTYTIAPNAALNPISVVESATCSISIPTYNSWSLAAPATVTFTGGAVAPCWSCPT